MAEPENRQGQSGICADGEKSVIPAELSCLRDGICHRLPFERSVQFPMEFADAIEGDKDLSLVCVRFMHWLLTDVMQFAENSEPAKKAIEQVTTLLHRKIDGLTVSDEQWNAARYAAGVAAESAGWTADDRPGYARRTIAGYAARAAAFAACPIHYWSVEDAAWAAAAAGCTRTQQADKLLELIRETTKCQSAG